MAFQTVDLCDQYRDAIRIVEPIFRSYGKHAAFCGAIQTVKCYEDNVLVKETLSTPGNGRVLVVDGGGSLRCALVGDMVAGLGAQHGWSGIVLHGCVRDIAAIADVEIGIRALNHFPLPSVKRGEGVVGVPVTFGGVTFAPGQYLYADIDGIVVSDKALT
jgi:regulator of ribonuclease activity A